MVNLVLFGAPGAGKGTLAEKIKRFSPVVHVSTGDLFRENVKNGTPIGKEAKSYMDAGKLVPDSVVIGMVKQRISQLDVAKNGFMLDGFPRTIDQAKALDSITKLNTVVVLDIEKEVLKKRILGRWSCPKCGKIYNIYTPNLTPKVEGKCDDCKETLTHRSDDNEKIFEERWTTYLSQSQEVIKYYQNRKGMVVFLDGSKTMTYSEADLRKAIHF